MKNKFTSRCKMEWLMTFHFAIYDEMYLGELFSNVSTHKYSLQIDP